MSFFLTPNAVKKMYSRSRADRFQSIILVQIIEEITSLDEVREGTERKFRVSDGIHFTSVYIVDPNINTLVEEGSLTMYTIVQMRRFYKTWVAGQPVLFISELEVLEPRTERIGHPVVLDDQIAVNLASEAENRERDHFVQMAAEQPRPPQDPRLIESVTEIITLLNKCTSETEIYQLCKNLLQTIEESKRDCNGRDVLEDTAKVFDREEEGAFLHICSQLGKLDVLPLMAKCLSEFDGCVRENLQERQPLSMASYVKRLVSLGTNLQDIKHVVEILYHFAVSSEGTFVIIKHLYFELDVLLRNVKAHWEDEELVSGVVQLIDCLVTDCLNSDDCLNSNDTSDELQRMIDSGVILTISSILSLHFAKDPATMNLDRIIHFPKGSNYSKEPVAYRWLCCLSVLYCHSHKPNLSKAVRPMVPIMCRAFEQISKSEKLAGQYEAGFVIETLEVLLHSEYHKDFELVLSSRLMVHLMKAYETYPEDILFNGEGGLKISPFLRAIELFFRQYSPDVVKSTNNRINMLPTLIAFINSKKLLDEDTRYIHGPNPKSPIESCLGQPYATFCLGMMEGFLKEEYRSDSNKFIIAFTDEKADYITTLINFVKENTFYLEFVSTYLYLVLSVVKDTNSKVVENALSFLPVCLEHLDNPKPYTHKYNDGLPKCRAERDYLLTKKRNSLQMSALWILYEIVCITTTSQLQILTDEYDVFKFTYKVLKNTDRPDYVSKIMKILLVVCTKHTNSDIAGDVGWNGFLPILDKMKKLDDVAVKNEAFELMLKLSLRCSTKLGVGCPRLGCTGLRCTVRCTRLPSPNVSHCEPLLVEMFQRATSKPIQAGAFRLAWHMVKCNKHTHLIKVLSKVSSDKTIELYVATPEGMVIAKIFKYLADIIVEFLEADPPCSVEHLTELTECMIEIAKSSSLDEESYVLEGMVSPAMWLLEKQSDNRIVANVKQFIEILHYPPYPVAENF